MIFVTSFNRKLYETTGRLLLESAKYVGEKNIVVCHEGVFDGRALYSYQMDSDSLLCSWLAKFEKHTKKATSYWNCHAARWFRKLVALEWARKQDILGLDDNLLVWIDCDCIFKKRLPVEKMCDLIGDASILYLKGPTRISEECGLVAYDFSLDAGRFFDAYLDRYTSGKFLKDERWDDCWQFQRTRQSCNVKCVDIGGETTGPYGPIFENSPLAEFIEHKKFAHGRAGVV